MKQYQLFVLLALVSIIPIGCDETPIDEDPEVDPIVDSHAGDSLVLTKEVNGANFLTFRYCPGGTIAVNPEDKSLDFEYGDSIHVAPFWISEQELSKDMVCLALNHKHLIPVIDGVIGGGETFFDTEDPSSPYYLNENGIRYADMDFIAIGEGSPLMPGPGILFTGSRFEPESGREDEPCLRINWFGAVLVCNWLSEISAEIAVSQKVYEITDDDDLWLEEETEIHRNRTGIRLPTIYEWQCAAAWQGGNMENGAKEYPVSSGVFWTPEDFASGANGNYNNDLANNEVAVFRGEVQDDWPEDICVPATKRSNHIGVFDMSGNAWEFCEDPDSESIQLAILGGSYVTHAYDLIIGNEPYYINTTTWGGDMGIRLVITANDNNTDY